MPNQHEDQSRFMSLLDDEDDASDGFSGGQGSGDAIEEDGDVLMDERKEPEERKEAPIIHKVHYTARLSGMAAKTVIVFDWDDTLLASTFLSAKGCRLDVEGDPSEILAPMRDLEQRVCAVLRAAMTFGHVIIITNAEHRWVELSAQRWMPSVAPLLEELKVISARSTYETHHPEQPLKWKFCAFEQTLYEVYGFYTDEAKYCHKNVISFGDSHVEREAVRAVTRGLPNAKTKSVKFAERPSVEQLQRQLQLVENCFAYIASHNGDLDLQLTVTATEPPAEHKSPQHQSVAAPAAAAAAAASSSATPSAPATPPGKSAAVMAGAGAGAGSSSLPVGGGAAAGASGCRPRTPVDKRMQTEVS